MKELLERISQAAALSPKEHEAFSEEARSLGQSLEQILLARGRVKEDELLALYADVLGLEFRRQLPGCAERFVREVPLTFARQNAVAGIAVEKGELLLATADPFAYRALDHLAALLGLPVRPILAPAGEIQRALNAAYMEQKTEVDAVIENMGDAAKDLASVVAGHEDLLDTSSRSPVIKLVNLVLLEAVRLRASDIHVQPYEEKLQVRFRIDGILHDFFSPPKHLQEEILSRVKVMGRMNIAEKRLPQDGRATVEVGGRIVDLRIASLPTSHGERIVIRILDKSARLYNLEELGMTPQSLKSFEALCRLSHGIVLVTGPTGCGKTTTLYAVIKRLDSSEMNIVTLEDPIEYQLQGISQTQISEKKGLTFAKGLRHVLRQDPDVIMVGEIRDQETARMAIQSALTGHLVFSTMHTNDAAGAATRILDLGMEPYLVSSTLAGVLAERLVRRICPHCREAYPASEAILEELGVTAPAARQVPVSLYRGAGCDRCLKTGYWERVGIFELLCISDTIRELILRRASATEIKAEAIRSGMETLRQGGAKKVLAGVTTPEEVLRVTAGDSGPS